MRILMILFLAGCTARADTSASHMVEGRYFVTQGAPDPLACKADKECIADTVTGDDGCCVISPQPWPQTWAWHTWISQRRMSAACKRVKCPPLPAPIPPAQCYFDARCVKGRCQSSCK